MQNISLEGIGKIQGGVYDSIKIDGIGSCEGDLKAEIVIIDGTFTCTGDLEVGVLNCDGMATFEGTVRARTIDADGMITIEGTVRAGTLDVEGMLTINGETLEAEKILCDGSIHVHNEISADLVEADGFIFAHSIVGEKVVIKSQANRVAGFFTKNFGTVQLIEATTVEVRGVKAHTINGHDITIGPNCKIDTVDCSGTLYISNRATVGTVTGNYTVRNTT